MDLFSKTMQKTEILQGWEIFHRKERISDKVYLLPNCLNSDLWDLRFIRITDVPPNENKKGEWVEPFAS